jgi:hypothetical protein
MKYFIDTEFIEGFKKPLFSKRRHFIDLISIGIVAEDGREYYAMSNEFDPKDADGWVTENVLVPIYKVLSRMENGLRNQFGVTWLGDYSVKNMKYILKCFGKSNQQIAEEIVKFINSEPVKVIHSSNSVSLRQESSENIRKGYLKPEFYGYYADYDWALFCSLFGRMIDLPKGFPMYCIDLKQTLDELAEKHIMQVEDKVEGVSRREASLKIIKSWEEYPKQANEHNALADAKWNFELYKFLQRT